MRIRDSEAGNAEGLVKRQVAFELTVNVCPEI